MKSNVFECLNLHPHARKGVNHSYGCSTAPLRLMQQCPFISQRRLMRFFLPSSLHREMDKTDFSLQVFHKVLLEMMLSVSIWRCGCLLGIKSVCGGLRKGDAVVGDCLCLWAGHGDSHSLWWESWKEEGFVLVFPSPFAFSSGLQILLCVLHHGLCFPPTMFPVCYDLLFYVSLLFIFSPLLFLLSWLSLTGTQEFLPL